MTRLNHSSRHHLYLPQLAATPPPPPAPCSYSWEEQAFAEDAAGGVGGCIWPPRSYSCSFCGREFRSAQALGGHMNVHRRDRARLKHSPSPTTAPHPPSSLARQLQLAPAACSPNPSPDPPLRSPRVSADTNSCSDKSFFPSAPQVGMEEEIYTKRRRCSNPRSDLSAVSLNLVFRRGSHLTKEKEEDEMVAASMGLASMLSGLARRRQEVVLEMMKTNPPPAAPGAASCLREESELELDLELRLGLGDRPPKVNSI
ncbi:unnamed protein product [Linum tenue]|uniref:C2H2-type domain-containing protein n=1 Tax=Linum tenue TaxID=586396 RepID=A0AAV0L0W2_9ROSI|nr:unnamed protein product [Linum tenue]